MLREVLVVMVVAFVSFVAGMSYMTYGLEDDVIRFLDEHGCPTPSTELVK
ncbi:hypothetical protein [Marinobacter sp. CA1]|nr:hypothetical protein [Marinobacter sp. CA1]UDL05735.1 hypothetical protein J2887_02900 [Marinobacter sp. CA1]